MTTSGLASPPRAARPRLQRPEPRPAAPPRIEPPDRASFEKVLGWSFALSVLAHLIFLLLSPLFVQMDRPPGAAAPIAAESPQAFGLEMVVPIPSESAPQPAAAEEPTPTTPPVVQPPPAAQAPSDPATPAPTGPPAEPPAATDQPPRSTNDALRPGYSDPRLYVTPNRLDYSELEKSDHERYLEHLYARLDAVNDSMGIAANRERRTSDWTVTDRDGNRWGVSPEGLHLGGLTIPRALLPLPAATGDNRSLEAEREEQRQRDEIQRQEETGERRRAQEERIDAMREEQDRRDPDQDGS